MKTILSYNVNGIRAAAKKGFFDWMQAAAPDIVCVQETKAQPDQLDPDMLNPPGYFGYWHSAEKKGYSGVAIFSREQPLHVELGCGIAKYDLEGRILRCDYPGFSVMSVYFPSGSSGEHRQAIKEEFMPDFYEYIRGLLLAYPNLILSGDFNIAHREIDIHDPKGNKNSSGFLPHEREWFGKFLDIGFEDSFRAKHEDVKAYSWWSQRSRAREQNKGWRIDYHLLSKPMAPRCVEAAILPEVAHSDHCPVSVTIE